MLETEVLEVEIVADVVDDEEVEAEVEVDCEDAEVEEEEVLVELEDEELEDEDVVVLEVVETLVTLGDAVPELPVLFESPP